VHKTANVLNYLPKSAQAKAKAALHEIWMAETRTEPTRAFDQFVTNYPKATECLAKAPSAAGDDCAGSNGSRR
jgi:transposase-like protein